MTVEQLQGMLRLKQAEIEQQMQAEYDAYRELHLFGREDDDAVDFQNIVIEMQVPVQKRDYVV